MEFDLRPESSDAKRSSVVSIKATFAEQPDSFYFEEKPRRLFSVAGQSNRDRHVFGVDSPADGTLACSEISKYLMLIFFTSLNFTAKMSLGIVITIP